MQLPHISGLFSDFVRIWQVLPPSLRRSATWVLCCIFFQAIMEVGAIMSISVLALSISAPDYLFNMPAGKVAVAIMPSLVELKTDSRYLALFASGAVAAFIIFKNMLFAYVSWLAARFGENVSLYASDVLFRQYLFSSYGDHLAGDSAEMFQSLSWSTRLANLATDLMDVYTYFSITFALAAIVVIFTPKVVLLAMLFLGLTAVAVYRSLRGHMVKRGESAAECARSEGKVTLNAMRGIRETIIYRQQEVFFQKRHDASIAGRKDRVFLVVAPPIPSWVLESAGFFVIAASVYLMIAVTDSPMARITAVVSIVMLTAWRVLPLLNRALSRLITIQGARHAALECLKAVEEALNHPVPEPVEADPDFRVRDRIVLKNVTFSYPKSQKALEAQRKAQEEREQAIARGELEENPDGATPREPERPCLRNISLVIPKGARVGLVGRSGAGKSTLSLILSGLATPDEGEFLIDGAKLNDAQTAAYRACVGFVPQNPYIMGGSIAENVAFSQWGLPWDEEKVRRVCQMAEFDVAEKRGIDACLGQDGAGLSGGQAQRLAIARALYAEPAILIFDEATSALDSGVEKAIMETIYGLPRELTTIAIAHRLETVGACDLIYWLEDGEIVDSGPPEKILPRYKAFLNEKAEEALKERQAAENADQEM